MRKLLIGGVLAAVGVMGVAGPAFAHDCFNPNKPAGAGSWATVTLDENGNEAGFEQTKKQGGFITIDATAVGAGQLDIHTFGNGGPQSGVAGGPNLADSDRACDGNGIDLAEACFGAGGDPTLRAGAVAILRSPLADRVTGIRCFALAEGGKASSMRPLL